MLRINGRPLIFGLMILAGLSGAAAVPAGWATYVHPQYGTRIDYPAYLFPGPPILTGTGATFEGNGAYLEVSAVEWEGVRTVDDLLGVLGNAPGYENVTYSPRGARWLVVSGYRGNNVFYEKFFVTERSVQAFLFEYPVATRHLFDPVIELIEDSFRAGP